VFVYPLLPLHYFSERKSLTNSLLYYFSAGKQERKLATYCSMLLPPYSFVFFFPSHLFHCLYQEKLLLKERETWNPATTHFLSCYICIYAQAIEMGIFMSCSFLFLFFEKKKLIFFLFCLFLLGFLIGKSLEFFR
jgi:hypothetical protein